jgi:hypothetical protein
MNIPIRTAEQQFTLDKFSVLPAILSGDKYAKHIVDFPYFGLSRSQRDYILLNKGDVRQYTAGDHKVCEADSPLYDARVLTCEASLFFQAVGVHNLCRRILLFNYDSPNLQKQGSIWLYHFPGRHKVSIPCPLGDELTETLFGAGIIRNASTCDVE